MRYFALASDYDGTLAQDGRVPEHAVEGVGRLRKSGRKVLLVTGREMPDLESVFPRLDVFDRIVAENGALLYRPDTKERRVLGKRPPDSFIDRLRARGVAPLSIGEVIVATWTPHENAVLDTIREFGLECQVIFNKGAVMILPSGVNKMSGLVAALEELGLSTHNVVGVGDAENDHAFLSICECSAAVANALPSVKEAADVVTRGDHAGGVMELIEGLIGNDLHDVQLRIEGRGILLGETVSKDGESAREILIEPYGASVLVAGSSGSGKSTLVTGLLERLTQKKYQMCLIDPEGDYEAMFGAVTLGDEKHAPGIEEVLQLVQRPDSQAVVNLLGVKLEDRPAFLATLLPRLQEMRAKTGRPHWVVVDEAHHMFPESWAPASAELPDILLSTILITVHPEHLSRALLEHVSSVIAVGKDPGNVLTMFAECVKAAAPEPFNEKLEAGEAVFWKRDGNEPPVKLKAEPPAGERRRHKRKYMEGSLIEEECFRFRGPYGKLNLKAQNLKLFLQIAEGIDEETWNYHLKRHDYSKWFEGVIKDPDLAKEAREIEDEGGSVVETRRKIRERVEERYTAPA